MNSPHSTLPIWKFGTRWVQLTDYGFHPQTNQEVPQPSDWAIMQYRAQRGTDLPTSGLVQVYIWIFGILMIQLKWTTAAELVRIPANLAIICFLVVLLFYLVYLHKYYRVIWAKYFSLNEEHPNDKAFFFNYGIFVALFSIASMLIYPLAWPVYITVLFIVLAAKKIQTQNLFHAAVQDYLTNSTVAICSNVQEFMDGSDARTTPIWVRQLLAARELSKSFTRNFIVFGTAFGLAGLVAVVLAWLYEKDLPTVTDATEKLLLGAHQVVSLTLVGLLLILYISKIFGGGIDSIRDEIENGDWKGFTLLKWPWK